MSASNVDNVKKNINKIYETRRAKLYALSVSYAAIAVRKARAEKEWDDRTFQAVKGLFAVPIKDKSDNGFQLWHKMFYGIYLELANDRKYEIIRPVIADLAPKFLEDARKII